MLPSIQQDILEYSEALKGRERQKQPPEVFYKKGVLKIFPKFTVKHLWQRFVANGKSISLETVSNLESDA